MTVSSMPQTAIILAGGRGSRLRPHTVTQPKPMVRVGGSPILVHIIGHFCRFGVTRFVICVGYLGDNVRKYFQDHAASSRRASSSPDIVSFRLETTYGFPIDISIAETGIDSNTGGRLRHAQRLVDEGSCFVTYGDGFTDADLAGEFKFHEDHGRLATVLAVRPPARFGSLTFGPDGQVERFVEKDAQGEAFINGGYFIVDTTALALTDRNDASWEFDVLPTLQKQGDLYAFRHEGFWLAIDTERDLEAAEHLWNGGAAPWGQICL